MQIFPGISLIPTPGHTFGHLSIAITLSELGPVLLTADAISRPDELADDMFADADDSYLARVSAQALRLRAARDHAWLIYGHCPQQWQVLRRAPYWYR
jgi:N-acyl homoserine lactone hydrolase